MDKMMFYENCEEKKYAYIVFHNKVKFQQTLKSLKYEKQPNMYNKLVQQSMQTTRERKVALSRLS